MLPVAVLIVVGIFLVGRAAYYGMWKFSRISGFGVALNQILPISETTTTLGEGTPTTSMALSSPRITLLSPSSGPVKTQVKIIGIGFIASAGASEVYFDGVDAGKAVVIVQGGVGSTELSFIIPTYQPISCPPPQSSSSEPGTAPVAINCDPVPLVSPGFHKIAVKVGGSMSNAMEFKVLP